MSIESSQDITLRCVQLELSIKNLLPAIKQQLTLHQTLSTTLPMKLATASSSSSVTAEDPQVKNVMFCMSPSVAPLQ